MVEALGAFQLTPFQYMALSLAGHSGTRSTADLARRFQITPQSMNEVVAALEAKDLIKRSESPDHRRILHVRLTDAGKRLLQKCDMEIDRIESRAFRSFTAAELARFRELMARALSDRAEGNMDGQLDVAAGAPSASGRRWKTV